MEKIKELETKIMYKFKNQKNLINALSHSSYVNENKLDRFDSNERLEFLGDSILNLIISENIFNSCSEFTEGDMTRIRANIVCESSLLESANRINLGKYLLLGKGEEQTGGRKRASILSDAFEALIGSIYIDSGMDSARKFILFIMESLIRRYIKGNLKLDYKTELQEKVQKNSESKIVYEIVSEKGPDHDKIFISNVMVLNKVIGTGQGKSKKEAEQNAAKEGLKKLNSLEG